MHIIYRVLLFVTYFGILIHCQGGGSRGGGGGGRGGGGNGSSCKSPECQRFVAIVVGIIFGVIFSYVFYACYGSCCKGRPRRKNSKFVNLENSKQLEQEECIVDAFQSGIWSSRYFQYKKWHGPCRFFLSFDPRSKTVTGSGSDDIGTFTIDGTYSVKTRRIGLTKKYQAGAGNRSKNLGYPVTTQLTWNAQNNQFEGKWYVRTNRYQGEDIFELKFDRQQKLSADETV